MSGPRCALSTLGVAKIECFMSVLVSLESRNPFFGGVLRGFWQSEMQQNLIGVSPAPINQLPALRPGFCHLAQKFAWNNSEPWCALTD